MKKLLLASSLVAIMSSSAFAEETKNFYIRLDAGSFINQNINTVFRSTKDDFLGTKMAPSFNIGIGGYLLDNLRADINFTYNMDIKYQINRVDGIMDLLNRMDDSNNFAERDVLMLDAFKVFSDLDFPSMDIINKLNRDQVTVELLARFSQALDSIVPDKLALTLGFLSGFNGVDADGDKNAIQILQLTKERTIFSEEEKQQLKEALERVLDAAGAKTFETSLSTRVVMPRIYLDFYKAGDATFFAGFGLGYANIKMTKTEGGETKEIVNTNNFAWRLHTGGHYNISDQLKLNVEYGYNNLGPLKTKAKREIGEINSHTVTMGLIYQP